MTPLSLRLLMRPNLLAGTKVPNKGVKARGWEAGLGGAAPIGSSRVQYQLGLFDSQAGAVAQPIPLSRDVGPGPAHRAGPRPTYPGGARSGLSPKIGICLIS